MKNVFSNIDCFSERVKIIDRIERQKTEKDSRLHYEIKYGVNESILKIISKGLHINSVNIYGQTPLMLSARYNRYQSAIALIQSGANIKLFDKFGHDALAIACIEGNILIAELLINYGASLDEIYYNSKDLLNIIMEFDCAEKSAELLINRGVFVHNCDELGNSPFYLACGYGHYNICKKLIEKNVDINTINFRNANTAFMAACESGHLKIAELLFNKGANIFAKNKDGHDAMYLAINAKHKTVVDFLFQKGMRYAPDSL